MIAERKARYRRASLVIALVYPQAPKVGMANLGYRIVLDILKSRNDVDVRRIFLEDVKGGYRLVLPDGLPDVRDLDLIAASFSYEPDILRAAKLLHILGIPLGKEQRNEHHPFVLIGGGITLLNPVPLTYLADAIFLGEAETALNRIIDSFTTAGMLPRIKYINELKAIPGIWIPSDVNSMPERIHVTTEEIYQNVFPDHENGVFRGAVLLELGRGCTRGCFFCAVGSVYLPYRTRTIDDVFTLIRKANPGAKIGLVGTSVSDYTNLKSLIGRLHEEGFTVSISSMRADSFDEETANLLKLSGTRSLSIAPEAGSQRLRDIIGKSLSEEDILSAVAAASDAGLITVRLYFMIGLPWETENDIADIVRLVQKIRENIRPSMSLSISLSPFIPKPWTPFQWAPMTEEKKLREKIRFIRKKIEGKKLAGVKSTSVRKALEEGILSLGDKKVGKAACLSVTENIPFTTALKRCDVNWRELLFCKKKPGEHFPWDFLCSDKEKTRLFTLYQKSERRVSESPSFT